MADPAISPSRLRESSYLAILVLPLIVYAGLLTYGFTQQLSAQRNVEAELSRLRADGRPLELNSIYTQQELRPWAAHEENPHWQDLLDAIAFLDHKYDEAFRLLLPADNKGGLVPASQAWSAKKLAETHHQDAAPLIKRMQELVADAKTKQDPNRKFRTQNLSGDNHWRGDDILMREFAHAYHNGDSASAAELLELYVDAMQIALGLEQGVPPYKTIDQSLEHDFWQADNLQKLRSLLNVHVDRESQWRQYLDIAITPLMKKLGIVNYYNYENHNQGPEDFPFGLPSTHIAMQLRLYSELNNLRDAGTREHVQAARAIDEHWQKQRAAAAMTNATEIPWAISLVAGSFWQSENAAAWLAMEQMKHRRTLTAVAIKQFQLQEGRWPTSLAELTRVGLAAQDWKMVTGIDFGYRVDADGRTARLWSYEKPWDSKDPGMFDKDFRFPVEAPSELRVSPSDIEESELEIR